MRYHIKCPIMVLPLIIQISFRVARIKLVKANSQETANALGFSRETRRKRADGDT